MKKTFSNKYGTVILTPVTKCLPISKISYEQTIEAADNLLSIEEIEKVTLITMNKNVQPSLPMALGFRQGYIILHETRGTGYVCNVEIKQYVDSKLSPALTLSKLTQKSTNECCL